MVFRPPRLTGVLVGFALTAWAGIGAALLVFNALSLPASLGAFLNWTAAGLLAGLALLFAYWTLATLTLRYTVDRNVLAIRWGGTLQLIPLGEIKRLIPGANLPDPRIQGLNAPGLHVGRATVERAGETLFYSTHRNPAQLLYVVTTSKSYALTVTDQRGFAEAIEDRQGREAEFPRQSPWHGFLGGHGFWVDRWAYGLVGLGVAAVLTLAGYVFWRFPGLPPTLELDFPAVGGAVRFDSKTEVLRIPLAAMAVLGVNLFLGLAVHRTERMAAYLLWGSAAGVGLLLWAAALIALHQG